MEKTKIFLSYPQVVFREGIHFILSGEDDFEVTGETTNNEQAIAFIEGKPPDIAVLSMENGKYTGPEITRRIKRSLSSVSVILVMERSDEEMLFSAMKSGASACLTKDSDPEYLLDVIRVVAQGSHPIIEELLVPGLASRVLTEFEDLAALSAQLDNMLARLAPSETDILKSIAAGNGIEQVAAELGTNEENIRRNLRLILNKLVVNDQSRALIEAAQRSMPLIIGGVSKTGEAAKEYVTKAEFNKFKESLDQRLKIFTG
jgi:two-component system response regulator DevR